MHGSSQSSNDIPATRGCGASCLPTAPTSQQVLDVLVEKGDWGKPMPRGKGRGVAPHDRRGRGGERRGQGRELPLGRLHEITSLGELDRSGLATLDAGALKLSGRRRPP